MRLLSKSHEDTFRHGARLGTLLKKGGTVCLYGDLGAGKTVFAKGIASALGIHERDVTSASFTIVAEYKGTLKDEDIDFYHIDLYRIEDAAQLDSIGIDEYIGGSGVSVIEWAERIGDIEGSISVWFKITDENQREISIEGIDEKDWNNM